jgi:hypothetical protein
MVGAVFPLFTLIFGQLLDIFNDPTKPVAEMAAEIKNLCIYFVIIAIASAVGCFFENFVPVWVSERALKRAR